MLSEWKKRHPDLWEFILFNILANCATVTNFLVMWFCSGLVFRGLREIPFSFFVFHYTTEDSLMLCGFLSFLVATTAAQIVNFFVQKHLVFRSQAAFSQAVPKYIVMVVVLVTVSAALPGYSQEVFVNIGMPETVVPTLANVLNILLQVLISYPAMKWWIMPAEKSKPREKQK